jgi:lipid-A-disaccharide synthase
MLEAVVELRKKFPKARFVLPVAPTVDTGRLQAAVDLGVELVAKPLPEVISGCDFAWVASGTAALETALVEVPMAVVYIMASLPFAIARHLVKLSHISLPNILAGKGIVPEFLQGAVNAENLVQEATAVLTDPALRRQRHSDLRGLRQLLGEPGAAARAADAIIRKLEYQKT